MVTPAIFELTKDVMLFNGCKAPKGLIVHESSTNDYGICEEERKRTGNYCKWVEPAEEWRGFKEYSGYNALALPIAYLVVKAEKKKV